LKNQFGTGKIGWELGLKSNVEDLGLEDLGLR